MNVDDYEIGDVKGVCGWGHQGPVPLPCRVLPLPSSIYLQLRHTITVNLLSILGPTEGVYHLEMGHEKRLLDIGALRSFGYAADADTKGGIRFGKSVSGVVVVVSESSIGSESGSCKVAPWAYIEKSRFLVLLKARSDAFRGELN